MKLMKAMYLAIAALGVLALANCSSGSGSSAATTTCYTNGYGQTYQSGTVVASSNCSTTYQQVGSMCETTTYPQTQVSPNLCGNGVNSYSGGYYNGYGNGYGSGYGYGNSCSAMGYYCSNPYQHLVPYGNSCACSY